MVFFKISIALTFNLAIISTLSSHFFLKCDNKAPQVFKINCINMKFILLILGLVAITAGSTYFVAPQLREFHEGMLKKDVRQALGNSGYLDADIEMNHLHAEKINIRRIAEPGETEESVKVNVENIVKSVYGATVDFDDINVKFEFAPDAPIEPEVIAGIPEINEEPTPPTPMPEVKAEPDLEPEIIEEPKIEPKTVLASSAVYVEWNDRKNEIRIDGKLSNTAEKNAFISLVKKQFKSAVITDNMIVSKDQVAVSGKVLEIDDYIAMIIKSNVGKGSVKIVDNPASVALTGTLSSRAEFRSLTKKLEPLLKSTEIEPLKVENNLKYRPEFIIEKDDKQRVVVLSGYANRNDSVNLSSYIKSFTQNVSNQYKFKSEIAPDERSSEYIWTSADQKLLSEQLRNTVRGKIYYENDMVAKVTGITTDPAYPKSLIEKFGGTATKIELIYNKDAKPKTPKVMNKDVAVDTAVSAGKKEKQMKKAELEAQAEAKTKAEAKRLRNELKEYKIYFDSGKKDAATMYDPLVLEIAKVILKSEDKKSVIVIGGFADHTGDPVSNEKLSKERATSVQAKLVEQGIPISRTKVEFFGAEGSDVDKKLSRRVEIRVR